MFEKLVSSGNLGQKLFSTNEKAAGRMFRTSTAHDNRTEIERKNAQKQFKPSWCSLRKNKVVKGDNSYVTDKKD